MRKIRLDVEKLTVESFDTAGREMKKVGTVRGHDSGTDYDGCVSYYSNCASCLESCPHESQTCFGSCRAYTDQGFACIDPNC
jgi:hypothetical protein